MQNPAIVVPGIQASGLEDFYPIPPDELWSAIANREFERIAFHQDNVLYETVEPARAQPLGPLKIAYKDLVEGCVTIFKRSMFSLFPCFHLDMIGDRTARRPPISSTRSSTRSSRARRYCRITAKRPIGASISPVTRWVGSCSRTM